MATFDYLGNTWNIKYVDPSLTTGNNDGSTPDNALQDLPSADSMSDNDCYLIRRTASGTECTLQNSTNNNSDMKIMILGMPKSNQPLYEELPTEVKTAWDSDIENWARINKISQGDDFEFDYIKIFALMNIYHTIDSSITDRDRYVFYNIRRNDENDRKGTGIVRNCIFTHKDGRIEDLTTAVSRNKYGTYLRFSLLQSVIIENCEFDHSSDQDISVYFFGIIDGRFINNKINVLMNNSFQAFYWYANRYDGNYFERYLIFRNNEIHYYSNGDESYGNRIGPVISISSDENYNRPVLTFENIKLRVHNNIPPTSNNGTLYITKGIIGANCLYGIVRNIDIDFTPSQNITNEAYHGWDGAAIIFGFDYIGRGIYENQWYARKRGDIIGSLLENVTIKISDDADAIGDKNNMNQFNTDHFLTSVYTYSRAYPHFLNIKNLTSHAKYAGGLSLYACQFDDVSVEGYLKLDAARGNITHWETDYPGNGLNISQNSNVYFNEIIFNRNNPDYPYVDQTVLTSENFEGIYIVANSCNIPLVSNDIDANDTYCSRFSNITSLNDNGASGNFRMRSRHQLIESWNVQRETNYVLRFTQVANGSQPLTIGRYPSKGITLLPTSTGNKIFNAYIAYKNYSDENGLLSKGFYFIVKVPHNSDDFYDFYDSRCDGNWIDDNTSTWTNDSGLTQKKIAIPINVYTTSKEIEVEVCWNYYAPQAYLYLDPYFEVV